MAKQEVCHCRRVGCCATGWEYRRSSPRPDRRQDESTPETLLDRVCAILQVKGYDITCEDLEDAFAQAGGEM